MAGINKRDILRKLENLKKQAQAQNGQDLLMVTFSDKGHEYLEVNGTPFLDTELFEAVKGWENAQCVVIGDFGNRRYIAEDFSYILYFPSEHDLIDYIRVEHRGLEPLHHETEQPYQTITREKWLETWEQIEP